MFIYAYGEPFECSKATKGPDYIILDDGMGAAFYGISDFSGYTVEDGEWSEPEPDDSITWDALAAAYKEGVDEA